MAKPKGRRSSIRSASKVQEEEFIERARELAEDPSLVLTECRGRCILLCPFKRANARILKAHAVRDDPQKLQRLASGGNVMGRAYAATLSLIHQGKATHLAQARLPTGTVSYAYRGTAPPFSLIGIQYHDEPELRLLGAAKFVKSRKIHVYSMPGALITTHKTPAAPPEFVAHEMERLGFTPREPGRYACPHPDAPVALALTWRSANATARLCSDCAGEKNLVHQILTRYAGPEAVKDFAIAVEANGEQTASPDLVAQYLKGAFGDRELITRSETARLQGIRAAGGRGFVIAGERLGDNADAFLARLNPTPVERTALQGALAGLDRPVVIDRPSPMRALTDLWPDRGLDALAALTGDRDAARELHNPQEIPSRIPDLLAKAAAMGDRRKLDAVIPRFSGLPKPVATADDIARTHRLRGREETIRLVNGLVTADPKERAVALAALQALGAGGGQAWKFGRVETDLAAFLEAPMRTLLEGEPARYADALSDLASRAGFTEPLRNPGTAQER